MAVYITWAYECDECGQTDTGYDTRGTALKAELAHLKECTDEPEVLAEKQAALNGNTHVAL